MAAGGIDPKFIASLPKEVLETLPAGAPPPGTDPNFLHPPTLVPLYLSVIYVFLFIALATFSLRMYTKATISKNWQWDDLTISIGFVGAIMYTGFVTAGSLNGGAGKHLWDIHLIDILNPSFLLQSIATTLIVTPTLGLIKSSFFIQYYVLFHRLRWVRISVWIGAVVSVVFYFAVTIAAFVMNSPRPGESLFETLLSPMYLRFANFSIPTGVIGMLVDWYLLCLPIPVVMGLAMSTTKKLGVLIVFMTGAVAAVASVVTLNYRIRLQLDSSDATWKVAYVHMWAQIEMFAGVAASSMPTVKQFFVRQKPRLDVWGSSFMASVTQLMVWPTSKKGFSSTSDYHSDKFTITTRDVQMSEDGGTFEPDDAPPPFLKPLRLSHSQIHVTHEVSVINEDRPEHRNYSRQYATPF